MFRAEAKGRGKGHFNDLPITLIQIYIFDPSFQATTISKIVAAAAVSAAAGSKMVRNFNIAPQRQADVL